MLFFFKQKTAYEMRISDWSSDVCSSDLGFGLQGPGGRQIGDDGAAMKAGDIPFWRDDGNHSDAGGGRGEQGDFGQLAAADQGDAMDAAGSKGGEGLLVLATGATKEMQRGFKKIGRAHV